MMETQTHKGAELASESHIESVAADVTPISIVESVPPHPETAEILRQVEYYFSDENLPSDAHILSLAGGDGNGSVSINEILGFQKMRRFKPKSQVKASLRLSKLLEVVEKDKRIKRRYPLTVPLKVEPKYATNRDALRAAQLREKPWLTKAMLKPTGFEEYATEGPLRPQEYNEDRVAYGVEECFATRIENAVNRYAAKRKMHQSIRNIFIKFLMFGGFDGSQRQFGGGLDDAALEGYDKDQVAEIKSAFCISDIVLDGIDQDDGEGSTVWSVDFVTMAKAFLFSRLLTVVNWCDGQAVKEAVNVPRNFYNYLLLHDVCPEYNQDILRARQYCDLADEELPRLGRLDSLLPGDFSRACSILSEGYYAASLIDENASAEWKQAPDHSPKTVAEARFIFYAGVSAHGTSLQIGSLESGSKEDHKLHVVREETTGLEIVDIQYAQGAAADFFKNELVKGTVIRPLGKLLCRRWKLPNARPKDLPEEVAALEEALLSEQIELWMTEDVLRLCTVGVKIEAVLRSTDFGMSWIDNVIAVYPTNFVWTANETVWDWKTPNLRQPRKRDENTAIADTNDQSELD